MKKAILYSLIVLVAGCKKYLQVDAPPNQVNTGKVFLHDGTATSAVNGIYSEMMNNGLQFSASGITLYAGLSSDEMAYYLPGERDQFRTNQITEGVHTTIETYFWTAPYKYIYSSNLSLEKLQASTSLTPAIQTRLSGEVRFIRAFCYFYLVNLFGDVPLITSSDYRENERKPRADTAAVYQQMISDLSTAANELPDTYTSNERVRPTRWAALALLARVYLYQHRWADAEATSSLVLASGKHALETDPAKTFLKNSSEAIWQLLPVNPVNNTWEGNILQGSFVATTPNWFLDSAVVKSAEPGDRRIAAWTKSRNYQSKTIYYPNKYKVIGSSAPLTEYYMVLRLAEQYLIRAEARAQQGKIIEAGSDIATIRTRAGLLSLTPVDAAAALLAIEQERRIEFLAEWGDRWFNLKRSGRVNAVIGALKPLTWQATDARWPIPIKQIQANPALVQNPGY